MAKDGHGLPKVSPGPTIPYRQATPETAQQPFQGWPVCWAGSLRPSFTLLDTPRHTSMLGSQMWTLQHRHRRSVEKEIKNKDFREQFSMFGGDFKLVNYFEYCHQFHSSQFLFSI
jgi:hypothetical protein